MIGSIFFHPWVWIIPIIVVILLAVTILCIVGSARTYGDPFGWAIGWVLSGIVLLVLAVAYFGFMLPPYDMSFHQTYRVTGEISDYHAAFDSGEGVLTNSYVLEVEGVDYRIYTTDQRLRTYAEGDEITLVCGKIFNYFQEPYLDCSIGGQ